METERRPKRAGWRRSAAESGPELARWLALFLIPTLAFKILYLTELYGSTGGTLRLGLFTILDSMGEGGGWLPRILRLGHLLCVDVLEVTIAVSSLSLAARLLVPRARDLVMAAVLLAALVVTAANTVSVRQLGTLLTAETLAIAYHWTVDHPSTLAEFASLPKAVFLVIAVLWAASPLLARRIPRAGAIWLRIERGVAPCVLGAATIGSLLGLGALLPMTRSAPRAFGGYWSAAIASLRGTADPGPCAGPAVDAEEVAARYRRLVFPFDPDPVPPAPVTPLSASAGARHVIVVVLETAPRKFYPLTDDPTLPTFHRMTRSAIVGERHYTPVPFTKTAIFSIVSGTYPRAGRGLQGFGDFESDSMPTVLARSGYESTFIDSYKIDWRPGLDDRKMWRDLGFRNLLDQEGDAPAHAHASFEVLVDGERRSFERARQAVLGAEERGRSAFALIATAIGHYEWKAPPQDRDRTAAEKIHGLAAVFDQLLGALLEDLSDRGLGEKVLVVVTGDHGLRYGAEFASLGEKPGHGDAAFQVPFLVYAPGLVRETVRLPYVTSHVDIAPTVLALLGENDRELLHHGMSVLDPRIATRTTFMMDQNLSPVGGLYRNGYHYEVNHLTGAVVVKPDPRDASGAPPDLSEDAVKSALHEADAIFDATGCVFLRRASGR